MSVANHGEIFLQEAADLLEQIEGTALELESNPGELELINRLFRAFHTIKGSGSMFGFDAVASFTHHIESALDRVRNGGLEISKALISLILSSRDHIRALLESAPEAAEGLTAGGDRIAEGLAALCGDAASHGASTDAVAQASAEEERRDTAYAVYFRPAPSILVCGLDPICLLNDLRKLGSCTIEAVCENVPPLEDLLPDHCYLAWNINIVTAASPNAIRDVFIFAEDGAEIRIEEHVDETVNDAALVPSAPRKPSPDLAKDKDVKPSPPPLVNKAPSVASSVRVPSERLDQLVNLVGELVINQSRLSQAKAQNGNAEMAGPVEAMDRLIAELRDSVLGIRMMPIGATFSRFQRLVRDLSAELGKEIDLVAEGAETELDKTVLDQLGDPLVHLIRNSMDHGIETPEARLAKGKPRRGTLRLTAVHEGAHVVITIEDDGRGLDKAALRTRAEEKGLINPDAQLSEQEIFNLIFLPGFSTAKTVSNVSGRGVGMDVVKRTIEGLRGSVSVSSPDGRGAIVRLTLPLTLAIIEGLLIEIEQARFIVPMTTVMENVELSREERRANNGRNAVTVRGALVPYIPLRELFEIRGPEPDVAKIVIVNIEGERLGLVVDRVVGSHQTVIQSLGPFYRGVDLFSGTTIMGDGRVAMILSLPGILRCAGAQRSAGASMEKQVIRASLSNQSAN